MPEFEIISFEGAFPLKFGMLPNEIASIVGPPRLATPNWQGVLCYNYDAPNLTVGFGGEGQRADHFGFGRGASVGFRGVDFFADRQGWRQLLNWSSDYHECLGFLVFCDLGVALTGFHDDYDDELAVTAFPLGRWEKFRKKFQPYELTKLA